MSHSVTSQAPVTETGMEALPLTAFIRGLVHEMNSILTPLVAMPHVLLDEIRKVAPPESMGAFEEDLDTIRLSGRAAASILRDLSAMVRPAQRSKSPVQLNRVIERALSAPPDRRATWPAIGLELSPSAPTVAGDPEALQHLVTNLLFLAFCAPESVRTPVLRTVCTPNARIEFEFAGAMVEAAQARELFSPFRIRRAMGLPAGSGLLLTAVEEIARQHGGNTDVRVSPGKVCLGIVFQDPGGLS
jgi:C4-dicarboxylate-specific signal transduction histidine kinase